MTFSARTLASTVMLASLLAMQRPLAAAGKSYLVRTFPNVVSGDSTGDREAGASGAFWFVNSSYDNPTGKQIPRVVRLATDGSFSTWTLDVPQSYAPTAVRRDPNNGSVWVLVPLFTEGQSVLYKLNPLSNSLTRYPLTFVATRLALDPVSGVPWVTGTGKVARLTGNAQAVFSVDNFEGGSSGIDSQRRIWLSADNGTFKSFSLDAGTVDTYGDAASSMVLLDVDTSAGRVWAVRSSQDKLICFTPSTREKVEFPLVRTSANWGGIGVGSGGLVSLASSYGPHFLAQDPTKMTDGVKSTLTAPTTETLFASTTNLVPQQNLAATKTDSTSAVVDRVSYAESDGGRYLFSTTGVGYVSVLWSNGTETLTGTNPIQLWTAQSAATSFTTRAVLPVVAEVRPEDPFSNFLTEVTLTNIDAISGVSLTLQTSDSTFTVNVTLAAGSSRVFPNVIQSLRDLGASGIPSGAVGTLTAQFTNGKGLMAARVFTRYGGEALLGAPTTGLGYSSIDPASELFVYRSSLNGLKNTNQFRTNVAVANLCGASGTCPGLSVTLQFFNDATGAQVGEQSLEVPPNQVVQTNSPLASFSDADGETFSVRIQPFSEGVSGYEAYATIISNVNQDAAFVRAEALTASYNLTLPVVTDAGGIGTRFTSECAITSTTSTTAVADVTFTSALSGNSVAEVLTLSANRGVRYPNAVDHFRLLAPSKVADDDYGPVRIAFRDYATGVASARTTATNGTGLAFTAIDPLIARARRTKRIIGLKQNDAFRTNLAVVHPGATTNDPTAPITVKVTITDSSGNPVGSPLTQTLQPGRLFQWTKILSDVLGVTGEGYVATIERTDGGDAFDAYVTIIDGVSTDPTFLRAE